MSFLIKPFTSSIILLLILFIFSTNPKAKHQNKIDLSIGGRIKFDTIYNANSVGGLRTNKSDLAFSPRSISVPGISRNSLDTNLRESRIWATLNLPIGNTPISTYAEFDFFDTKKDASGRSHVTHEPRLRHLYGTFKNFTAGKTYSTFANISAYPEINDANGPVGNSLIRQVLIRYNGTFSELEFFLGVEKAESTFTRENGNSLQVNDGQVPDITGKIKFSDLWGNISFAAILREINSDNKIAGSSKDEQWGAALSIAGRVYLSAQNNLRFTLSYGNALGRYISSNSFNDATIDNNGNIDLTEIIGTHAAYQHWWTNSLRSSFVIGAAYANVNTNVAPSSSDKFFASSIINLLWSPLRKTTVGLEWLHAYRELENGDSGQLDRIQFSAVYKF